MVSKRKRTPAPRSTGPSVDVPQPSSRDASGEDAEDPVLREVSSAKTKQSESGDPSAKRLRSSRNDGSGDEDVAENGEDEAESGLGENDDLIKEVDAQIEAPPQAGMIHPKGYRTNPPPTDRTVRVYADGVFDLFHLGHMRQLEQAKKAFPEVYLIVGVAGDKETHRRKGLTVLSGKERAESVRHCKWVDMVVEDCPWVVTLDFVKEHHIDYVAHDDLPYGADEGDDIYAPIKAAGKFLVTQRTEGVSTTGIITKIVRDYDNYISRQLKRGTSRQELNISWLKKNEIDVKRHLGELRKDIRTNWTMAGLELGKDLRQFWQPSRPASPSRAIKNDKSSLLTPSKANTADERSVSPNPGANPSDFVTGYTLGLIGSVKSWMARSRHSLNEDEGRGRDMSSDSSSGEKSPEPKSRSDAQNDKAQKSLQQSTTLDKMDVRT